MKGVFDKKTLTLQGPFQTHIVFTFKFPQAFEKYTKFTKLQQLAISFNPILYYFDNLP